MKRFNDKAIIITGADSSLGRVTALQLAREGANVILLGTNSTLLEHIASELPEDHTWINTGNHLAVTCDITNEQQGERLVSHILDKYHRVDGLININTEVKISQALLTELAKTKGSIVNVSLLSDTSEPWSLTAYKKAYEKLTTHNKQLALDYGSKEVRVNGVHAGLTVEDSDDIDNVALFTEQSPLSKLLHMEEIANAILFLASHESSIITGTTLAVDGGLSLTL